MKKRQRKITLPLFYMRDFFKKMIRSEIPELIKRISPMNGIRMNVSLLTPHKRFFKINNNPMIQTEMRTEIVVRFGVDITLKRIPRTKNIISARKIMRKVGEFHPVKRISAPL